MNRTSIYDDFEQIFCVSDSEDAPFLPSTVVRIAKYVVFRTFFARYGSDVRGRTAVGEGVAFKRTMLDRGGGGGQKVFARTSLMDDRYI